MFSFLNKPYPSDHSFKSGLRNAIGVSIFLVLFFLIFQPFGIGNLPTETRIKATIGYGMVNFVAVLFVLSCMRYIFPSFYEEEKWVIWKEVLTFVFLFFAITIGCMSVNSIFFNEVFHWKNIFLFYGYVAAFGSLPVGFSIMTKYNRQLKKNLAEAQNINAHIHAATETISSETVEDIITLQSDNKSESLNIKPSQFYFAESSANYVTIHYKEETTHQKEMLRTTMKILNADLENQKNIIRCHRSFIINLDHIQEIKGDSRGYEITLKDDVGTVAVSRSYIPSIKAFLNIN